MENKCTGSNVYVWQSRTKMAKCNRLIDWLVVAKPPATYNSCLITRTSLTILKKIIQNWGWTEHWKPLEKNGKLKRDETRVHVHMRNIQFCAFLGTKCLLILYIIIYQSYSLNLYNNALMKPLLKWLINVFNIFTNTYIVYTNFGPTLEQAVFI